VHSDIRRTAVVAWSLALFLLTAPALMSAPETAPAPTAPAAAPASPTIESFAAAYARADKLNDEGAGARAREVLTNLLKRETPKLSDAESRKARALLEDIEMVLVKRYEAEEAARKRFEAQAAKRAAAEAAQKKAQGETLAQADRLVKEAEASKQPRKYLEAARLRSRVATERAIAAYERAMDLFEQGDYDKAGVGFTRLQEWVKLYGGMDVQADLRPSIGSAREAGIQKYLARIDDGKLNRGVGSTVLAARTAEEKKKADERAKYLTAVKNYDEAVMAYDRSQFDKASELMLAVQGSGVSLGAAKDAQVVAYLKKIADRKQEIDTRRQQAIAQMTNAQGLLQKDEWKPARELLLKTQRDQELLSPDQRKLLADLLKQAGEKEDEATRLHQADAATVAAATQYAKEAARIQKILEQQEDAVARMHLDMAKTEFGAMDLDAALVDANESLKHGKLPEAIELRNQILALQGKGDEMATPYVKNISEEIQRRLATVKSEMDLAIQRGRNALDDNRYDDAVKQFTLATEAIDYLRPYYDVSGAEAQVQGMLKRAQEGKAEAERKLNQQNIWNATKMAEEEDRLNRARREEQKIALFNEANAQYAQGKYQAALAIAEQIQAMDPEFIPVLDLMDNAREKLRHQTWRALNAADQRAKADERIKWREKLVFPAAVYQYPAKEIWDQINARGGVELPSGKAAKTPKELRLETLLRQEIPALALPGVPLQEAVEILKAQLPPGLNILPDPTITANADVLINLDVKEVNIGTALKLMLRPHGLDYIIANDSIWISTFEGCRTLEARPENLDLREYDVQDLLVVLNTSGGSSGTSSGTSTSTTSDTSSGTNNNTSGSSGLASGSQDLLGMIVMFTGAENWDNVTILGNSGNNNNDTNSGGTGGTGGGGNLLGGGGNLLGGGGGAEGGPGGGGGGATGGGIGRIMFLRNGYLMVNHVDRIHKKIEEILAMLRAQTTILVQVEARLITYNDRFFKDVGVSWTNLPHATTGTLGEDPGAHIPGATWSFSNWTPPSFTADPVGAAPFSISAAFLNRDHTQMVISMAEASSNATTVSAPHVTVINGAQQTLDLTTKGSYVSSYSVQGSIAIPVITTYDASIVSLSVTPVVSADRRYVTMQVSPQITNSVLGDPVAVEIPIASSGAGGSAATSTAFIFTPLTTDQSIDSTVRVPDRGTVVLGGLSAASESTGESGIPILSHIPILKRLISRSTVGHDRSHLLFLVTPTILLPDEVEP